MKQSFPLAVLALGLLTVLAAADDCTVRDPLVGIGYNIIYGNPDGDDDLAGRDPGIKYNYQILDITYDDGKSVTVKGTDYCVPDQASTVAITSCVTDEETYMFSGTASYQEVFSAQISLDASYENLFASFEFSGSSEYESVQEASKSSESVFYDKRAFCHESQSRYLIEKIPNADNYGVSKNFYYAFKSLPDISSSSITSDELKSYYTFLSRWGTHIIEESDLGGRRVQRYQSTLTDLYEYALESSSTSISLGGEYGGFSASVTLDIDSISESTSSSTEFGSYYKEITNGATLEYSDSGSWYIPDEDTNNPEPTQLYLVLISAVCEDEGYWTTVADELSADSVTSFLKNRCDNLDTALSNYAEYLGFSSAYDTDTLPLTWPEGVYGLLKPGEGCPTDTAGFSFNSGWREQYREEGHTNAVSSDNHFAGEFSNEKVKYYFCMKTIESANSVYTQTWPAGEYCIFKSKYGDCPNDFSEGWIKWSDGDNYYVTGSWWKGNKKKHSFKSTSSGIYLPNGVYKDHETTIKYCCRWDGSRNEDIYLPTDNPFYLIQRGGSCQLVSGMTSVQETMLIDGKSTKSGDEIPYVDSSVNPYKMYYCYYY